MIALPNPKTNRERMFVELRRARSDIASLTAWMEMELEHYSEEEINDDPGNFHWGYVGTLQEVRSQLLETLRFFTGFETTDEIQQSLDDLHNKD